MFTFQKIGTAYTCFKEKFGIPRQSGLSPHSTGKICLEKPFNREEGLRGIDTFSHLIITFKPHLANYSSLVVRPPRLGGNKKLGVFATRSPFRPNSICTSIVKLDHVDFLKGELFFSNHDILDETPILDIKPYITFFDSVDSASNGWIEQHVEKNNIEVRFSDHLNIESKLKLLIYELLILDPRPRYQKSKKEYAFKLDQYDIHFSYDSPQSILVFDIKNVDKITP